MLSSVPLFVVGFFLVAVFIAATFLLLVVRASFNKQSKKTPVWIFVLLGVWLAAQGLLAFKSFYLKTDSIPPRFALAIAPAFLLIVILFVTRSGRRFIDNLPLSLLTYVHVVRVFVEVTLFWLFLSKAVPRVMTFDGRNFDIVAGLSAPLMAFLYFRLKILSRKVLFWWNVFCILLLINIVVLALLSAPFRFQQLGFEQPNIAVLYFPFVWLPSFIVPVVFFSHLASLRQLVK
jgi:hypothetical protein